MRRTAQADPATVALMALSWILSDEALAARFLSLTGLSPDALRASIATGAVQGAVLDFLAGHESDLVAAAAALDMPPEEIVAAREALTGAGETP